MTYSTLGQYKKPLCIELFAGLGGWTDGFIAEGWDSIGFDIERHQYAVPDIGESDGHKNTKPVEKRGWTQGCAISLGMEGANNQPRTRLLEYPAQLVLQDVLTLHGSQFREADCIVASPPCQAYSYMAMPWTRAKQLAAWYRDPEDACGRIRGLTALFDACFRIQREASEAKGEHIPLVVENVCGAQAWVGRAKWHYGSFYLWGDVPALMPSATALKVPSFRFDGSGRSFQSASVAGAGLKQAGNATSTRWVDRPVKNLRPGGGNSPARKAASALIARIPFPLARHIASVYHPRTLDSRRGVAV